MGLRGIEGRVALVTGAARRQGIGRATAQRLAADGADVACLDLARPYDEAPAHGTATADELDEVVELVRQAGRRAVAVRADVSSEEEVEAAVAAATDALGTITLVANVAGGSGPGFGLGPLLQVPLAEFKRVLDVNLLGTWLVTKACASRMVAAGVGGHVANVSSQAGRRGFPFLGPYCAAKAGVISLTQTLAQELGPMGINVNAVGPGTVATQLLGGEEGVKATFGQGGDLDDWLSKNIPIGRLQTADDVADVLAWLLSDEAGYLTGEAIMATGGQTIY